MISLKKSFVILSLMGISSIAAAAAPVNDFFPDRQENLVFKLSPGQSSSCTAPQPLIFKLVYSTRSKGRFVLDENSSYTKIHVLSSYARIDKSNQKIESYEDQVTSKNGLVIILKGKHIMSNNAGFGTWKDSNGCEGSYKNIAKR